MAGAGGAGRNYSFKVVLLGEGCVGKTSVVLRYVENKFNEKHLTTLQVIHCVVVHYVKSKAMQIVITVRVGHPPQKPLTRALSQISIWLV